ncbi:MAG: hypothetical protein ACYC7E_21810 [Armatimonadota bacterium]
MSGHGEKLERKFEQAVLALLMCPSVAEAARQVGVNEATLLRWRQLPAFDEAYRSARRQVVEQAIGKLAANCWEAVETLRAVMTNAEAPASARISAAKAILDYAREEILLGDLAARLAVLEGKLRKDEG